jgi:hypothetical protein
MELGTARLALPLTAHHRILRIAYTSISVVMIRGPGFPLCNSPVTFVPYTCIVDVSHIIYRLPALSVLKPSRTLCYANQERHSLILLQSPQLLVFLKMAVTRIACPCLRDLDLLTLERSWRMSEMAAMRAPAARMAGRRKRQRRTLSCARREALRMSCVVRICSPKQTASRGRDICSPPKRSGGS